MVTAPVDSRSRTEPTNALVSPVADQSEEPSAPGLGQGPSNAPPSVRITSPPPNTLLIPILPQNTTVHWASEDPDGPGPGPKKYFYKILSEDDEEFTLLQALIQPDSLRLFYTPDYPGWTEVSGKETSFTLPDLLPNTRYLFVVQAVDRRGNEDTTFSLDTNMLMFLAEFVPATTGEAGPEGGADGRNLEGTVVEALRRQAGE